MSVDLVPIHTSKATVFGLDACDLLAASLKPLDTVDSLPEWTPESGEDVARLFPHIHDFRWIGRGGMAAVYSGRQQALDRNVALKLLCPTAATDPAIAERFRIEARILAQLEHPNIVSVYDAGETCEGRLYILMEYVNGGDLASLIAAGPLPATRALNIASAVCSALDYAHAQGIVHRDIKPANILLGVDGSTKVADFGLARVRAATLTATCDLTRAGTAVGTPLYVAPEQLAGWRIDARADLYSLGVMLYEMLTGELPVGAWSPPSHKVHSSSALDTLVALALQPDPSNRIQSAADFRARLEHLNAARPTSSRRRWLMTSALVGAGSLTPIAWNGFRKAPPQVSPDILPPKAPSPRAHPFERHTRGMFNNHRPFEQLDLVTASVTGDWHWVENTREILAIAYTHGLQSLKVLNLSVNPGQESYILNTGILLEHNLVDFNIIFPAGRSRVALVLSLIGYSGLESVRESDWKSNESTVSTLLPTRRFLLLEMRVKITYDLVHIIVKIDDRPFLEWDGPQNDLTLPIRIFPPALVNRDGAGLTLASLSGGVRLRSMEVRSG